MTTDDLSSRLELAGHMARDAGDITLRYFNRGNYRVETKADASPVIAADREAEQCLRRHIAAAFPQDAILGEEFGEQPGTSGFRWILDPIDGTQSFIERRDEESPGLLQVARMPLRVSAGPGRMADDERAAGVGGFLWWGWGGPGRPRGGLWRGGFGVRSWGGGTTNRGTFST